MKSHDFVIRKLLTGVGVQHFKTLFREFVETAPAVSDYRNSLSWKQFKKHFHPHSLVQPQSHGKGKLAVFATAPEVEDCDLFDIAVLD